MAFRIYILLLVCLSLSSFPVHGENYETEITICALIFVVQTWYRSERLVKPGKKMVIREFGNYQYDIVCMQEPLTDQIQDFLSHRYLRVARCIRPRYTGQ